jgi:hypothetical protein
MVCSACPICVQNSRYNTITITIRCTVANGILRGTITFAFIQCSTPWTHTAVAGVALIGLAGSLQDFGGGLLAGAALAGRVRDVRWFRRVGDDLRALAGRACFLWVALVTTGDAKACRLQFNCFAFGWGRTALDMIDT